MWRQALTVTAGLVIGAVVGTALVWAAAYVVVVYMPPTPSVDTIPLPLYPPFIGGPIGALIGVLVALRAQRDRLRQRGHSRPSP